MKEIQKTLRNDCNNYDQTVQAIKAVAHELLWDESAKSLIVGSSAHIGRRMDTSPKSRISQNTQVTPDLVISYPHDFGIIAEAKIALSSDPKKRQTKLEDIQKYDDNLTGWETLNGRVSKHDIILIVQHFSGPNVKSQIESLLESKEIQFERKFALVCFALIEEAEMWMSLELLLGSLSDQNKQSKLQKRLGIALEHVAANPYLANIKLYDAPPPEPLLMVLIHEAILTNLNRGEYLLLREGTQINKTIDIQELRALLSKSIGPGEGDSRIPEIPKSDWVRRALELFVKLKWAERVKDHPNQYIYYIKKRRKPFEQFLGFCAKEQNRKEGEKNREKEKFPLLSSLIEEEDS